jgi:hypothetical protein
MRTEAECPPEARYLYTDELYSDQALHLMQADCVRRYRPWSQDAAYHNFVNWTRQANEAVVFTWHAYADLVLPKQFDCLFHVDSPEKHLLVRYALTQSVINLAGGLPIGRLEHGHKHICVLTFEQEVPAVFQLLHQLAGRTTPEPPGNSFKLGFCQASDLPAIAAEHARVARLRAQHGALW